MKKDNTRTNNQTIIKLFIEKGISGDVLTSLNDIRINMQVTWLSELCNAKGEKIANGHQRGKHSTPKNNGGKKWLLKKQRKNFVKNILVKRF